MAVECKRKQVMYPVELIPSHEISPGYDFNPNCTQSVVVYVAGRKQPLVVNKVSDSYGLLPNQDLINPFEDELKKAFPFNVIYRHTNYARFFISYEIDLSSLEVRPGDVIYPKMDFNTSYDSTIAQHISSRGGRKLCNNGIFVSAPNIDVKFKHTSGAIDRGAFTYAVQCIRKYIKEFPKYVEIFKQMDSRSVADYGERMIEVIQATRFPRSAEVFEAAIKRLKFEMDYFKTKKATDWLIYNALNYQLNHNEAIGLDYQFKDAIDKQIFRALNKGK